MIVLSVMYPLSPETRFDLAYYVESHLPMVRRLLEPLGLREVRLYTGLTDGVPPPTYAAITELVFDDLASLMAALGAGGGDMQADLVNFTDGKPVTQFSEIVAL